MLVFLHVSTHATQAEATQQTFLSILRLLGFALLYNLRLQIFDCFFGVQ